MLHSTGFAAAATVTDPHHQYDDGAAALPSYGDVVGECAVRTDDDVYDDDECPVPMCSETLQPNERWLFHDGQYGLVDVTMRTRLVSRADAPHEPRSYTEAGNARRPQHHVRTELTLRWGRTAAPRGARKHPRRTTPLSLHVALHTVPYAVGQLIDTRPHHVVDDGVRKVRNCAYDAAESADGGGVAAWQMTFRRKQPRWRSAADAECLPRSTVLIADWHIAALPPHGNDTCLFELAIGQRDRDGLWKMLRNENLWREWPRVHVVRSLRAAGAADEAHAPPPTTGGRRRSSSLSTNSATAAAIAAAARALASSSSSSSSAASIELDEADSDD